MNTDKIILCNRCNNKVEIETELDYPYYCPNCDENMYEFETHTEQNDPIIQAIETLKTEGEKSFRSEYIKQISNWQKVGMAISSKFIFSMNMFDIIYTIAEDWNFHDICAIINFVFRPEKHTHYLDRLQTILPAFLNKEIECLSRNDDGTFDKKKIKVSVTIEEIE